MSLITRCPACGTMFKVVADQLKVSEGWVRCGHCDEVFDAAGNLQHEAVVPTGARATPAAVSQAAPGQVPPSPPPPPDVPQSVTAQPPTVHDTEGFSSSIHTEVSDDEVARFANSGELAEQVHALRADPLDRPFELKRSDTPDADDVDAHAPTQPHEPLEDLSFVRQARRKAFWQRPVIRAALVLAALMLVALLALQIAWQDRDRLAAADPELRPWLLKLCEVAQCTIGPPRQIDAIAIDSSSFNRLRADTFRLNVALKNRASTEVAMPSLELTLTDSQDQAVVRRVLPPSEYAGHTATLQPGADWSTSLALAVTGNAATRISGYRVLAFYP